MTIGDGIAVAGCAWAAATLSVHFLTQHRNTQVAKAVVGAVAKLIETAQK